MSFKVEYLILFIILVILIMIITVSLISPRYFNDVQKIAGKEVYDALQLNNCYRIHLHYLNYINNEGKLKDKRETLTMKKNKKILIRILDLIKELDSTAIEIKGYTMGVVPPITHKFQFDVTTTFNIQADYSIKTNQLLIPDSEFPTEFFETDFPTQVVIIKMNDEFNKIITNLE